VKTVYLKSRLMDPNDHNYEAQLKFDETIVNTLDIDFNGEGPRFDLFAKALIEHNISLPVYVD
jgi:hypothetical protein